jgi:uncharacterized protein (TIGR03382 family)
MTRDPVFSFNASLPDVSRDHTAQLHIACNIFTNQFDAPRTLVTEQGWVIRVPSTGTRDFTLGPSALRIETLFEEGAPQVLTDNAKLIAGEPGCGCTSVEPASVAGLLALVTLLRRRRAS